VAWAVCGRTIRLDVRLRVADGHGVAEECPSVMLAASRWLVLPAPGSVLGADWLSVGLVPEPAGEVLSLSVGVGVGVPVGVGVEVGVGVMVGSGVDVGDDAGGLLKMGTGVLEGGQVDAFFPPVVCCPLPVGVDPP
jgi:hypothetical protein